MLNDPKEVKGIEFSAPYELVRNLGGASPGARVDLVLFRGKYAVCKTFGYLSKFKREKDIYKLSGQFDFIPMLLEEGDNWLVVEYLEGYDNVKTVVYTYYDPCISKSIFYYLKELHDLNYALLDFHAGNVLVNPKSKDIKFIDFEHSYKYRESRPPFLEGASVDSRRFFEGYASMTDIPEYRDEAIRYIEMNRSLSSYSAKWQAKVGVPIDSLMNKPVWLLRAILVLSVLSLRFVLRNIKIMMRYRSK